MLKIFLRSALVATLSPVALATTTLSAGDIAVVGFNADNPDEFAFVALTELDPGTEIRFTDNGWTATNTFRDTEGTSTWTAPSAVSAGSVFQPGTGSMLFSTSGDQILAYQGSDSSPTFAYGIHFNGAASWDADSTSSNTSALPTGLVEGTSALALGETDSGFYEGPRIGSKANLQSAISDAMQWTVSNDRQTLPTDPFRVLQSGDLLISEVMFNPNSNEDDWEWIEIFNSTSTAIDLTGWVLDDENSVALGAANISSGSVGAGETAILFNADDISATQFGMAWGTGVNLVEVNGWSALQLNNSGDKVSLWSDFLFYEGDNQTHNNAVATAEYPNIDDGFGSVFLSDLSDPNSWALSKNGISTPLGTSYTSRAAGGNGGLDVASPGGTFASVPMPATLALLGLGLAGIGYQQRRKAVALL
jgi:hypothetical protein